METSLFFGGSLIAAIIAGMIALFAPCCISFMLPAYFASAFQNRRLLMVMTFLFAAGVATVILPIVMGASVLRQIFTENHPIIYTFGGIILIGLTLYTLLGGVIHLPMPGHQVSGNAQVGPLSVYTLGVFSGITSSCCAPVLAGVIALAGVATSFIAALGLGLAYVFGMVAPLFVISLLWDRADWKAHGMFRKRTITYRLGSWQRTLTTTNLATAILLGILGIAMIWIGLTTTSMATLTGWQASFAYQLQHVGQVITDALAWLPNWLMVLALVLVLYALTRYALRQLDPDPPEHHPLLDPLKRFSSAKKR